MNTKIVNFIGQPGAGKSTLAALVFAKLKLLGINTENVYEYAKKLTWHDRQHQLKCQPLIFGKQLNEIEQLLGKVDVILTDSPVIMSAIYSQGRYPESFSQAVLECYNQLPNINYFVQRTKAYNPAGRTQTEQESDELGVKMLDFLKGAGVKYEVTESSDDDAINIVNRILTELKGRVIGLELDTGKMIYKNDIRDYFPVAEISEKEMIYYPIDCNGQWVITSLDNEIV